MHTSDNTLDTIPKIIHYCWFGKPMPTELKQYVESWNLLHDYKKIEWNDTNCTFNENAFVRKAYSEKAFGFLGDYYRLKVLYEYGGIYLDTDVKVFKSFDPLLSNEVFLNFIFNSSIGTAIIGAKPHNAFIKQLLDMYDNTIFDETTNDNKFEIQPNGKITLNRFETSNHYFTTYILKHYPTLKFNNTYQDMKDFVIYPKELFEIGSLLNRHYTIHYCAGAWRTNKKHTKSWKRFIRNGIYKIPKVEILVRKIRYHKLDKQIPFYSICENRR